MYAVGYQEGVTTDPERPCWTSVDPRPLSWSAWYPASQDTPTKEKLIGSPGSEIFRLGHIAENADLSLDTAEWPVVLLSHGTGGSAQGMSWLGCRLAAKGFIAVGVSHHGNTIIEPYRPEGFLCWWDRARDLTVILDWFATEGPFANRVDPKQVFAAGFSLGGYTVFSLAGAISKLDLFEVWLKNSATDSRGPREFPDLADHIPRLYRESRQFRESMDRHSKSYRDSRIKAVVSIAPAPPVRAFEPDSLQEIAIPVHIIVGRGDTEAPFDECALWLQKQNAAFDVDLLDTNVG
ncbi:MAG: dienelactone hydrolase, partial [Pseudomonadota bacterium]